MENDEDIYHIRNNINQGYQLEDPEKIIEQWTWETL